MVEHHVDQFEDGLLIILPQTVTGGKTITYTYDATGQKLRRVSPVTGNTDYIAGIQYDGGAISFIQTEEGKAVPDGTGGYNYTYYLGDNLGNTRITFDTATGAAATVQADNYYPFGMEQSVAANGKKKMIIITIKRNCRRSWVNTIMALGSMIR